MPHRTPTIARLRASLTLTATLVFLAPAAAQPLEAPSLRTAGGVHQATFPTVHGKVRVYLPSDMNAGDVISGTVIAEPAGADERERTRNAAALRGYVIVLNGQPIGSAATPAAAGNAGFRFLAPAPDAAPGATRLFSGQVPPPPWRLAGRTAAGEADSPQLALPPGGSAPSVPAAGGFGLPAVAQQGAPVQIIGAFDGDAANTRAVLARAGATTGVDAPFSIGAGAPAVVLAESPRALVFESPLDVAGPVQVVVWEGGVQMTGVYRNVGVRLTVPKTELLNGEQTTLTVEVEGLAGLTPDGPPVQLSLANITPTVVHLEGGDQATQRLEASQVGADGRYVTTRIITGQQAGTFSVSATVSGEGPPQMMLASGRWWLEPEPWDSRSPTAPDAPVDMNRVTYQQLLDVGAKDPRRLQITRCDLIWRRRLATTYREQLVFDEWLRLVENAIGELGYAPRACHPPF